MKTLTKITLLLAMPLLLVAKEATVEQLFSVQITKVKKVSTHKSRKNFGFVKADDARIYHIAPRYGGFVTKIYADKIYQYVKKDEPLLSLYSPEVYKAKEDYLNSYNYTKNRPNKGMLRSAKLKLLLLGVSEAEINKLIKTKKITQETTIYAPKSGYIFKKNVSLGSAFNAKTLLYEIVNLDEVWVETKVFEKDVPWLKTVQNFDVSFNTTPNHYKTTQKFLYPMVDEKEAALTLRLRLNNQKGELFPGMYAKVYSQTPNATYLTLPSEAVLRKDGKFYAFVVGEYEGEYEPVELDVAPLDAHTYIIKNGLKEGDAVVSNALFMMDSDAQINGLY